MKNKNLIRGKQNKGFTLVEVLIAVTILAIIVAPLLHAFVTAARTNAKAKELMKATTLAENVFEELKANSLEDIARQFNSNTNHTYTSDTSIVGNASTKGEAVMNGTVLQSAVTSGDDVSGFVNASVIDAADPVLNPEGVFVGQDSGNYYFQLGEVVHESSKYDILIEIAESTNNGTHDLTQINGMNEDDCGYFAQQEWDDNAAKEFYDANTSYQDKKGTLLKDEFYEKMVRTITIDIASVNDDETVNVTYDYEIEAGYTEEADRYYSEYLTIFDNYLSKETLKAVYVYYNPLYGGTGRDNIIINNRNNLDVDVYLIKMQGDGYTAEKEAQYLPSVKLIETASNGGYSNALICTNISRTLSMTYNIVGSDLRHTDLGNVKETECLYDVTIKVYRNKGTAFDEDNRVATFTGSMLDNSNKQ